jgi:glycine cleavage system aminomethyltransferase T
MGTNQTANVKLTPLIPNLIPRNKVFVCPESSWMPDADGAWQLHPFAFDRWDVEEMSYYDTCSLHCALNPFNVFEVHGADYLKMLEFVTVNTFRTFPVGKARHTIFCDDGGKILTDGIVIRTGEEDFLGFNLVDPNFLNQQMGGMFNIQSRNLREEYFVFQLCGARSLEVVEQSCRKDLHDLKFMWSCDAEVAGAKVRVLRTGMAGTLAYEIHGNVADAQMIYGKLLEVGAEYGIQEIGRLAYVNQHCEGSIFQLAEHFNIRFDIPGDKFLLNGSLPADSELQYHSPYDCGWGGLVRFGHEFPGKAALLEESERLHNTAVHLLWNKEDVLAVQAATMDPERRVDYMDMVGDYDYRNNCMSIHMDAIMDGDQIIGASSGRMLSAKTREMISIATLREDYAEEGREVEVLWGRPGTHQMRVRATVTLFPYIKEGRNDSFDTETIPHPSF